MQYGNRILVRLWFTASAERYVFVLEFGLTCTQLATDDGATAAYDGATDVLQPMLNRCIMSMSCRDDTRTEVSLQRLCYSLFAVEGCHAGVTALRRCCLLDNHARCFA